MQRAYCFMKKSKFSIMYMLNQNSNNTRCKGVVGVGVARPCQEYYFIDIV